MRKKWFLFLVIILLIPVLMIWAPWITAENAAKIAVNQFEKQWQDVANGCGFNCEGCGVKNVSKQFFGYAVGLEYACGMLPADEPEYHQYELFLVSPFATVHKLAEQKDIDTSPKLTSLLETEWILVSINNISAVTEADVTLAFPNPNEFSGFAGCNYFGGRFASGGTSFTIDDRRIDRTRFDCDIPASVIEQEVVFFNTLPEAKTYQATENRLVIKGDGKSTLEFTRKLPATVDPGLLGTEWILSSIPGQSLLEQVNITLNFEEETAGGYGGCNHYGGKYAVANEGQLSIPEIASTAQDCATPDGVMVQEKTYVDIFGDIAQYQIKDNQLELAGASGDVRLVYERKVEFAMNPADLIDTTWQLTSLNGEQLTDGAEITISFINGQELEGFAACREYTASYEVEGDNIRFPMLSMGGENCFDDPELLDAESKYIDIFGRVINYKLNESRLEFISVRNEILTFEPLQKAEE
jgi:heat shock protein HslJ